MFVQQFTLPSQSPQQILLVSEWQNDLLGVLCPRSLEFRLVFRVGYVSSARLPYVALLYLVINAGLPLVALLFLILIKCGPAVPNYTTTFARSSQTLQRESYVFQAILSHQTCLELVSNVKVSSHCLAFGSVRNGRSSVRSSCEGNKYGKNRTQMCGMRSFFPSIELFEVCE